MKRELAWTGLWSVVTMTVSGLAFLVGVTADAQTISVTNPSFEEGNGGPTGWTLSGGEGAWQEVEGAVGARAIVVTGTGEDTNFWRTEPLPFEPNAVYRMQFKLRDLNGTGGQAFAGTPFANRDATRSALHWNDKTAFFMTPAEVTPDNAYVRCGQWHVTGSVAFDAIEVVKALPVYHREAGLALGEGERLRGNAYEFHAPLATGLTNVSRPLAYHHAMFNTNRWALSPGAEVVYRHSLEGRKQASDAAVDVAITYHTGGRLVVEASGDGTAWRELGALAGVGSGSYPVPADLLPADALWVRLRTVQEGESSEQVMNLDTYVYRAVVDGAPADVDGSTRYAVVRDVDPRFKVEFDSLGELAPDGVRRLKARVSTTDGSTVATSYSITPIHGDVAGTPVTGEIAMTPDPVNLEAGYALGGTGVFKVLFALGTAPGFKAEWTESLPILEADGYGEMLPGATEAVGLWWASSGWKVSRHRALPAATGEALAIAAARNETEAAQLVLKPVAELKNFTVKANALAGPDGASLPAEAVEVLRVRYVNIQRPTDETGGKGLWPDPLPPLPDAMTLEAGVNQPLWVRVHVPKDTPAGRYAGTISLRADGFEAEAPLRVDVHDFTLPDRMTCQSAFGFSPGRVYQYQKVTDPAQQREVLDKYMASFSAHRISPYDPTPADDFVVTWPETQEPEKLVPSIDWTAWDAAMTKAIDTWHFNSFRLSVPGMGGGTFHSRTEPSLLGFAENTPQYQAAFRNFCQVVQEHLREKGWLDEAYVYWFDEPDPKDYDFVMNGFRKLKEAAPDITRMLTEQVEEKLIGGPNLWCPISNEYNHEAAEKRRAEGERFWWYVCTGPKAPYATLFIDHAGTELRVWLWQTWQRKIGGILIWQSNYWTSAEAYPGTLQNPYDDPMSWQTSYGIPAGTRSPWGNGDGRFVYPPEAAADGSQEGPVLEGPVDSMRWEMLRDGLEDYEYFVILRRLVGEKAGVLEAEKKAAYEALLQVPASVTTDMTTFTTDPAPLEAHRAAVAKAIEELSRL